MLYDLLAGNDLDLAGAHLNEGRPEQAVHLTRRSVRLVPTDPCSNFMLAVCLLTTDGDLDEAEAAARVARTDERLTSAGDLLGVVALRRLDRKAAAIRTFVGDLADCRPPRIQEALRRTRALHTEAERSLRTIGGPLRDQLTSLLDVLAENAVQLELALVVAELTRVVKAGRHRGMRAELDGLIRRCADLRAQTRKADTLLAISQIEGQARMMRERV